MSFDQTVLSPRTLPKPSVNAPGNPAATASAVFVMMGLAILFTPRTTGRLRIILQGILTQTTTADGTTAQISYGTGGAPANGAAVTGTQAGQPLTMTFLTGVLAVPAALIALVTGLVPNVTYWFDIALKVVTGGSAAITTIEMIIEEY